MAELLTVAEVAQHYRVDPSTVRRWIASGSLKAIKVGGTYRVPAAELGDAS